MCATLLQVRAVLRMQGHLSWGSSEQYDTIAVAHNGNIVNGDAAPPLPTGIITSTTESEIIALLLLYAQGKTLRERMIETFPLLRGSYSLVMLAEGKLYAMRDPWGMRPLCIGRIGRLDRSL